MNKIKLNASLASIILIANFLVGWQSLIFVTILMLIFCELNDSIKDVLIKTFTFLVGYTLLSLAWSLVVDGVDVITNALNNLVLFISSYLKEPIDISGLNQYLLIPLSTLVSICNDIVDYLLVLIKFAFVVGLLLNKPMKENFITKWVNYFVKMATNFVNKIEKPVVQSVPVTNQVPAAPVSQDINISTQQQ